MGNFMMWFAFHTLIGCVGLFMGNLETCCEKLGSWGVTSRFLFFILKAKVQSRASGKWLSCL